MSIKPKEEKSQGLGYFKKGGPAKKFYELIQAAYYNENEKAKGIIENDPDQIARQDPHSGLTALHIAVFRSNRELVEILATHPKTDFQLKDNFGRRVVDMLDYTPDQVIFNLIMEGTYPVAMAELDKCEFDDDDPTPPPGGNILPFGPKGGPA